MEFLRRTLADARLRLHVSATLAAGGSLAEALALAERHPAVVLAVLRDGLTDAPPLAAQRRLRLLERLVDAGGYAFHRAMARDTALHAQLVRLAAARAETEEQRRTRRLARLTVLEYSRMFADDPELRSLTTLVGAVEKCTGRSLLRSIEVENKKVTFIEPRPEDIILISPIRRSAKDSPAQVKPSTWSCHICTYMNKPNSAKCFACKTPKPIRSSSPPPPTPPEAATIVPAPVGASPISPISEKTNGVSATEENNIYNGVACHRVVDGEINSGIVVDKLSLTKKEDESAPAFVDDNVDDKTADVKTHGFNVERLDNTV
ncbi:zinc finger protein [Trypanosoma melophagium]|uniref:zinc finger protein n=1 Tax=Trypanosoma melophagium TaxID=715481 RepID=UPI00351A2360|nr:zinc finger protein [Trypanosoma melophagium]